MIPFRDSVRSRRYPIMTVLLIAANVGVFFFELTLPAAGQQELVVRYAMVPARWSLLGQAPGLLPSLGMSLFSSLFLHASLLHLAGNMWYLWIFGDNVEDRMGSLRFLLFYLVCGLLAGLAHLLLNWGSPLPTIGASGAVAGVLGAYLVSYPFARVLTLIPLLFIWPVVELPAILVLGSWFLVQFMEGTASLGSGTLGGVAWWAHVGGFLAGIVLLRFFARRPAYGHGWYA